MKNEYKVVAFVPTIKGCGARDKGWDEERCNQFRDFLNKQCEDSWEFYSSDFREVKNIGCGGQSGSQLICIFKHQK